MQSFDLQSEVVAVSGDGSYIVTRTSASLTLWTAQGVKAAVLPALVSSASAEHGRHAVSNTGLVAEANDDLVRVTQPLQNNILWEDSLHDEFTNMILWGDPSFSPDGTRLALPLQGQVRLLEATSGKLIITVGEDPNNPGHLTNELTLPRRMIFSPNGARLGIICDSNRSGPANATLFVADTASGIIVEKLIAAHSDGIADAAVLDDSAFTLDGHGRLRRFKNGVERAVLAFDNDGTLAVSNDASHIAVASNITLQTWHDAHLKHVDHGPMSRRPAYVQVETNGDVWIIDSQGKSVKHSPSTTRASAPWLVYSDDEASAWPAVWELAYGKLNHDAVHLLANAGQRHAVFRAALQFAEQLRLQETSFRADGPSQGADALVLAETYYDGGFLGASRFAYSGWFREHLQRPAPPHDVVRAQELGASLATAFGIDDDSKSETQIAEWMFRAWPDNERVVSTYVDAIQFADRTRAIATLRAYLMIHRSDQLQATLSDLLEGDLMEDE